MKWMQQLILQYKINILSFIFILHLLCLQIVKILFETEDWAMFHKKNSDCLYIQINQFEMFIKTITLCYTV